MNNEEPNTLSLVKSNSSLIAFWLISIILGILVLFLLKNPNSIFFIVLFIVGIILFYFILKESKKENPSLHMMEDELEFENTIIRYDEIEFFQFVMYKTDEKMVVDIHWWTPRILQLHIKKTNGKTLCNFVPNKMGNYESIKQEIRNVFLSKGVIEKKEKLR